MPSRTEQCKMDEVKRSLNERGRRMTNQRAAILTLLREDKSHPTAEEIHRRVQRQIPRISLGTVYRNLQVLVDEGCAIRLPADSGSHRFDGDVGRHHHARCRGCGRVVDVPEVSIPALHRTVEKSTGFAIDSYSIEFQGLCADCAGS